LAKTRRDRLIEAINENIKRGLAQQMGFDFAQPRKLKREETIEIAIKSALLLASEPKSRSDKAAYLAEVLTLPELNSKGISFISQQAVTGGRHYRGVAEHLRALEKAGVDIALVVKLLLTTEPSVQALMQRIPKTYGDKQRKIVEKEIGTILFWHKRRLEGHKAMQQFMKALRRRRDAIYGTPQQRAYFTRDDIKELLRKGVPREDIRAILQKIYPKKESREYVPRPKPNKRIIRRPR